jgi:hypothetical protein
MSTATAEKPEPEPKPRPRNSYDWDRFFDGNVWELIPGKDFIPGTRPFALVTAARMAARRRGAQVVIGRTPKRDSIWVQRIG